MVTIKIGVLKSIMIGKGKGSNMLFPLILNESSYKRMPRNKDIDDDYYSFYSALAGSITGHEEIWSVDRGASRHMSGSCDNLFELVEKKISQKVELGDNGKYEVKGIGSSSFQLDLGGNVSISNILYVLSLKKNWLSISSLEDRGYRIDFVVGQVLVWKKDSFEFAKVIGV